MELLSFLAIEFKWYHWLVISIVAVIIILAVVFFRLNTKTQMKVSFNMDDETNVYNLKGLDIYISKNKKKYTNPTLAVVEIKNLAIIYKTHSKKRELMVRLADLLLKGLKVEETLARIEFNKFVVVYNDRSKEDIRERLFSFDSTINREDFDKTIDIKFVVNFGVYEKPELNDKYADVKLADSSISMSPIKDKNIYYYCDEVTVALGKQNRINEAKQLAFEENRFVSYIQPKVSLVTGEVVGGEILCRWVDESQTPIFSPGEFIPIFEANGFIKQIDDLMFKNAVLMAATLVRKGYNDIVISVNLSKADIEGVDIVKKLLEICNEHSVSPKNIELEITESAVMNNARLISSVIMQLRQSGFRVAMDDFGKEYSSLSSLADNPFDTIKIDGVFFRDGLQTEKSKNIAKDILVMLSKLNIEIVCEGVETKDTVEKIAAINRDVIIQGFYFSKPIPTYQFESFVETKYNFDFPEEEEKFFDDSDQELTYLRNRVSELETMVKDNKGRKARGSANSSLEEENRRLREQLEGMRQSQPYPYPYPPYGYPYPPQYPQQPQQSNEEIEALRKEIEALKKSHKPSKAKPKTEDEEYEEYIKQFDEPQEEPVVEEEIVEEEELLDPTDDANFEDVIANIPEKKVEPEEKLAEEPQEEAYEEVVEEVVVPEEEIAEEAEGNVDEEYEQFVENFDNSVEAEAIEETETIEEAPVEEVEEQPEEVAETESPIDEQSEEAIETEEELPVVEDESPIEPESEEAPTEEVKEPQEEPKPKKKKSSAKKPKKTKSKKE